jgi:2'-5' RNA ligase
MAKVRTFIAIELPADVVEGLARVQEKLGAAGAKVKWVERQNLHLTVKFLGDVDYEKTGEISRVISEAVADAAPFFLKVHGIGTFPKGGRAPRVVWAGLEGGTEPLDKIFNRLNRELVRFGVAYEKRRFSPHATIGRVRSAAGADRLAEAVREHADDDFGEAEVSGLVFFMSELTGRGPVYTALAHIPLGGA